MQGELAMLRDMIQVLCKEHASLQAKHDAFAACLLRLQRQDAQAELAAMCGSTARRLRASRTCRAVYISLAPHAEFTSQQCLSMQPAPSTTHVAHATSTQAMHPKQMYMSLFISTVYCPKPAAAAAMVDTILTYQFNACIISPPCPTRRSTHTHQRVGQHLTVTRPQHE